jgi:hypothetical protein
MCSSWFSAFSAVMCILCSHVLPPCFVLYIYLQFSSGLLPSQVERPIRVVYFYHF